MFGDIDWLSDTSRGFVSISWASCYCTTLCVSTVFAVGRCPSVRPSVTFVYCIQTAKDIIKLLSRPGSRIILVIRPEAQVSNCKGSLVDGVKYTGVGKICNFRLKSPFISDGTREAHGCHGTLIGSHRRRINPCRFRWPWVTLKGGTRGVNISGGST